jgi:hypothetical protein
MGKKPDFRMATCPNCGHKFPVAIAFPLGKKDREKYEALISNPLIKQALDKAKIFFKSFYKRELIDRDLYPLAIAIQEHGIDRFDQLFNKWVEERTFIHKSLKQFINEMRGGRDEFKL